MPPLLSKGTQKFITRVGALPAGPGASPLIDDALKPALEEEVDLRRLFATDRKNPKLSDPYVGLVDVFNVPGDVEIKKTRSRVVANEEERNAKFVLPLGLSDSDSISGVAIAKTVLFNPRRWKKRRRNAEEAIDDEEDQNGFQDAHQLKGMRRKEGTPCMVEDLEAFKRSWNIFTEGSLAGLKEDDWNNVVVAGGSVLSCLTPIPGKGAGRGGERTKREMRKWFHRSAYPTSDVDLFLYGLTPEEAEQKVIKIYEAIRDSIPWETTCLRTKHVITIHSQYPYRPIQIVLRLYHSPAEILAGFDIDAPCVLYNGTSVFANPRAIAAMMRQCNTVDVMRRSTSYEIRLVKYAARGFEVYIPDLKRDEVDPTIFERAINRIEGLARLLVLEKLKDTNQRDNYLNSRRGLRSRPPMTMAKVTAKWRRRRKRFLGDLKAADMETMDALGPMANYDVGSLHIPYGPGWNARRIATLVYTTDLSMNSTYNAKNKGVRLHRHPAFFGDMEECMTDCCERCPYPETDEERAIHEEYSKTYVEGRVTFMREDPGRQSMTGSFNPIDTGEWAAQAYLGATEKFFSAIATHNRATVQSMIAAKSVDIHRRDHVGRTVLHLAIMVKAQDICKDLIHAGSRVSARVVDGRSCLHFAAQNGLGGIVEELLEKSKQNEERERAKKEDEKLAKEREKELGEESEIEVDESGDDWDSDGSDDAPKKKAKVVIALGDKKEPGEIDDIQEDDNGHPDILDINEKDWDLNYTPLAFAIVGGHLECVNALLKNGAEVDVKMAATKPSAGNLTNNNPTTSVPYLVLACKPLPSAPVLSHFASGIGADGFERNVVVLIFSKLLQAGATTSQADENLFSIFHALVAGGKARLVNQALELDQNARVAMNTPAQAGFSVLHWLYPLATAVVNEDFAMVLVLLAWGAKDPGADDIDRVNQVLQSVTNIRRTPVYPYHYNFTDNSTLKVQNIIQPSEVAISQRSPLIHLLADTGIQVSAACRNCMEDDINKPRLSLVDWVREAIKILEERLKSQRNQKENQIPPGLFGGLVQGHGVSYIDFPRDAGETWEQARLYQQKLLAEKRKQKKQEDLKNYANQQPSVPQVPIPVQSQNMFISNERDTLAALDYYKRVESSLQRNNAKTWTEIYGKLYQPLPPVTPVAPPAPHSATTANIPSPFTPSPFTPSPFTPSSFTGGHSKTMGMGIPTQTQVNIPGLGALQVPTFGGGSHPMTMHGGMNMPPPLPGVMPGASPSHFMIPSVTSYPGLGHSIFGDVSPAGYHNPSPFFPGELRCQTKYRLKTGAHSFADVPKHQEGSYDALFEACYKGDIVKIRELCMPQPPRALGQESKAPLQIAVEMSPYNGSDRIEELVEGDGFYTPLSVALFARRWDTAREILTIVQVQHKKPEERLVDFGSSGIRLTAEEEDGAPEDDEDDNSTEYGGDSDRPLFQTVDIAAPLPMMVECVVTPLDMLNSVCSSRVSHTGTDIPPAIPLVQCIYDRDLEGFREICDMYASFAGEIDDLTTLVSPKLVISYEMPEILDEYIRRTGWGIKLPAPPEEERKRKQEEEERKLYLGLNINRKKRRDLVVFGNPAGHPLTPFMNGAPPLWQAAAAGAKKLLEYFSTSKPLEAYVHYASHQDTELSRYIGGMIESGKLEENLPVLLGVESAPRAGTGDGAHTPTESLLTYTLGIGGSRSDLLEIVKALLSFYPGEVQSAMHSRNFKDHFYGSLLTKFITNFEPKVVNHLLSNGFSADGVDFQGWNILHIMSNSFCKVDVWEWFSIKLSQETLSHMLLQKSTDQKNTPLMVAIKRANITFVKIFLSWDDRDAVRASLLQRDANGFLPLHVAVRKGYARIAQIILNQEECTPEILHTENGVGETPLDTATALWMLDQSVSADLQAPLSVPALDIGSFNTFGGARTEVKPVLQSHMTYSSTQLQERLERMKQMMVELEDRILSNAKLKVAVDSFVVHVEEMVEVTKKREEEKETERKADEQQWGGGQTAIDPKFVNVFATGIELDTEDRTKVVEVVARAMLEKPAQRQLVHVADVLISVNWSLDGRPGNQDPRF